MAKGPTGRDRHRARATRHVLDAARDFIADALTEPAGSVGYLDLQTGFVTTEAMLRRGDPANDNTGLEDRRRWLPVAGAGSDEPHRIMRRFIAAVPDPRLAQQLTTRSTGAAHSVASTTSSPPHPTSTPDGSDTSTTHDSDAPEAGSPTTDTNPNPDNRTRKITPEQSVRE